MSAFLITLQFNLATRVTLSGNKARRSEAADVLKAQPRECGKLK